MNQVAEKKSAGLPSNIFEEDAAKGLGKIGQEDLALPFLKILGQLSPEVSRRARREQVSRPSHHRIVPCLTAGHLVVALGRGHLRAKSGQTHGKVARTSSQFKWFRI